jgi:hypothetical protein
VLVARDPPRIERYVRQRGVRTWIYAESHEADAPFGIEAIDCELRLENVYAKV